MNKLESNNTRECSACKIKLQQPCRDKIYIVVKLDAGTDVTRIRLRVYVCQRRANLRNTETQFRKLSDARFSLNY